MQFSTVYESNSCNENELTYKKYSSYYGCKHLSNYLLALNVTLSLYHV